MDEDLRIVDVDASNVDRLGFFCYKSKPKSLGYQRKLAWLKERFAEGMKIKIFYEGKCSVGFIEYIPGEYAWRAVQAANYALVHCLWVVGRAKGKGYGSALLQACMDDARRTGQHGVVMVSSSGTWLADKGLFLKNGFEVLDHAPPAFELLAVRFDESAPPPIFPQDWAQRCARFGPGLTVIRSDQCPYIDDGANAVFETAHRLGIQSRVVEFKSSREVQERAPSPFSVSGLVYDGALLSYRYLREQELLARLA